MSVQDQPDSQTQVEAMWRMCLTQPHTSGLSRLPSNPRCTICGTPFGGIGGKLSGLVTRRRPSRKNPSFCNSCDELMPPGGAEVDIAVLFCDVRGSTALAERMGASAFAALMNRFYAVATRVLLRYDSVIDKLVGDEVMALFLPNTGPGYRGNAARAAEALVRAVGYGEAGEPWLPLAVGLHVGPAFVGKVGSSGVHDFTALGDTVNTAARLQAEAAAGEVVLSEAAYEPLADRYPGLPRRVVELRGREEPLAVRILQPAVSSTAPP